MSITSDSDSREDSVSAAAMAPKPVDLVGVVCWFYIKTES